VLISHSLGGGDKSKSNQLFTASVYATIILSVLAGATLYVLSSPIISCYDVEGITFSYAVVYLKIRAAGMIFTGLYLCLLAAIRCVGKTLITMTSSIVTSALNVTFCVLIVNDIIPFENKVAGVALSGVLSQAIGMLMALFPALKMYKLLPELNWKHIKNIVTIGFPGTIGILAYHLSVTITTGIITTLGDIAINTRTYVTNIIHYIPIFAGASTQGSSIFLGRLMGRKDFKSCKKVAAQNTVLCIVVGVTLAFLAFLFSDSIMRLFTDNPEIIKPARMIFALEILLEFFRAFNQIYGNAALVCAKDVYFTSALGIVSCFLVTVSFTWLFIVKLGFGLEGYFMAAVLDEGVRAVLHMLRWKSNVWQKKLLKE
jgi:Na+-driven multidrug efflux pump